MPFLGELLNADAMTFLHIFTDSQYECRGNVTEVDVYVANPNWFAIGTWRMESSTEYTLVGKNGWDISAIGRQVGIKLSKRNETTNEVKHVKCINILSETIEG